MKMPTKAIKDWLLWIAAGGIIERTATSAPVAIRSPKRIGWSMVDKMEEEGWIIWSDLYVTGSKCPIMKCKVLLTEAGKLIASGEPVTSVTSNQLQNNVEAPPKPTEFELGVLYAAAQIVRLYDQPAMAASVICEAGLESVDCSDLDDFEKTSLRKLRNERGIALRGL